MIHSCTTGRLFSSQWHRNGFLIIGAVAMIALIYRRNIRAFFYPDNMISSQQTPSTQKPIPRNFTPIQIPSNVLITYQGSNAEYIVFKKDGSKLTEEEYLDLAVPILKLQFPRNTEIENTLSPEILDQLDQNESAYIYKALNAKGLTAIEIPKTLYDIFYIAFRFSTSASSLKEADGCQATTSLERFLYPSAEIYRYHPNLLVQESDIHKTFVEIDKEHISSKIDAELNNYIFQDLSQKKYEQNPLSWEATIAIVEDLFQRIDTISQTERVKFNCLYNKECPSQDCKVSKKKLETNDYLIRGHYNHYIFRMTRNFAPTQVKLLTIFKKALWHEFSQGSSVYTVYRGGGQELEREQATPILHSGSYGHSLCASCEIDMGGAGAIPIEYTRQYGYSYAVSINKADYRKSRAGHFLIIPPAQRTARFRLNGEFTHVRTRVHQPSPQEKTVHGMQNIAVEKVPYIVTRGSYSNADSFQKELRHYLDGHTYTLTE